MTKRLKEFNSMASFRLNSIMTLGSLSGSEEFALGMQQNLDHQLET